MRPRVLGPTSVLRDRLAEARVRPLHRLAPALALLVPLAGACTADVDPLTALRTELLAPESIDLGWFAAGQTAEARFRVENVGESTLVLTGARGSTPVSGLVMEAGIDGQQKVLAPGAEGEIIVRVDATREAPSEVLGQIVPQIRGVAPDDPLLPVTEVRGRVSISGLAAEPNPLAIGPVPYLATQTATVGLRNLRDRPVEVYSLLYSGNRAVFEESVTRGRFDGLPEVGPRGRLATLDPDEVLEVEFAYTAPDGPGEAKEQAIWPVTTCPDDRACALQVIIQGLPDDDGPVIEIPSEASFGEVPVGSSVARPFRIVNGGRRALTVANARLEGAGEFALTLPDVQVPPEEEFEGVIRFTPTREGPVNARLVFETNDPRVPTARVGLSGRGIVLPPCRLVASPSLVGFGVLELFQRRVESVLIRSTGDEECLVFDPQLAFDPATTPPGTFEFATPPPASTRLRPGQGVRFAIAYEPSVPGVHEGTFVVRTSGDQDIEVPLLGQTPAGAALGCSNEQTIEPGGTVELTARLAGQGVRSYLWRVTRPPSGGTPADGTFAPSATVGPTVEFTPDRLGTYEVTAEVTADSGEQFTCSTRVIARSSGLRASLFWDGDGDLDFHLHRGARGPWFGPDDCYFDNLTPRWVSGSALGRGGNPRLDRDDTSGDGPENILLETPEIGVVYTFAVSHFERAAGRSARVAATCGRNTVTLDLGSRPFRGSATGNCTGNDFWTVATVVFTAPDRCDVTPVDTYRTTAEACAAY